VVPLTTRPSANRATTLFTGSSFREPTPTPQNDPRLSRASARRPQALINRMRPRLSVNATTRSQLAECPTIDWLERRLSWCGLPKRAAGRSSAPAPRPLSPCWTAKASWLRARGGTESMRAQLRGVSGGQYGAAPGRSVRVASQRRQWTCCGPTALTCGRPAGPIASTAYDPPGRAGCVVRVGVNADRFATRRLRDEDVAQEISVRGGCRRRSPCGYRAVTRTERALTQSVAADIDHDVVLAGRQAASRTVETRGAAQLPKDLCHIGAHAAWEWASKELRRDSRETPAVRTNHRTPGRRVTATGGGFAWTPIGRSTDLVVMAGVGH
jgi:hypothetical protein